MRPSPESPESVGLECGPDSGTSSLVLKALWVNLRNIRSGEKRDSARPSALGGALEVLVPTGLHFVTEGGDGPRELGGLSSGHGNLKSWSQL